MEKFCKTSDDTYPVDNIRITPVGEVSRQKLRIQRDLGSLKQQVCTVGEDGTQKLISSPFLIIFTFSFQFFLSLSHLRGKVEANLG